MWTVLSGASTGAEQETLAVADHVFHGAEFARLFAESESAAEFGLTDALRDNDW